MIRKCLLYFFISFSWLNNLLSNIELTKSENVFSELNRKVSELENQKEKIAKLDELTLEMTKMLDEVTLKLTKFVNKKDLKEFEGDSKERFG